MLVQFLCGCDAADAHIRAVVVVSPEPLRGEVLGLPLAGRRLLATAVRLDVFDDVLVRPFMPDGAVVTFDVGVLLGLSWLDALDGNTLFLSPFQQLDADVFRAIIDPDRAGLATPFDDAIEAPDHALSRQ